MNWVQRKIYLYNVTFGLYMLDWWERCLFNTLMLILIWYVSYNGFKHATQFYTRFSLSNGQIPGLDKLPPHGKYD